MIMLMIFLGSLAYTVETGPRFLPIVASLRISDTIRREPWYAPQAIRHSVIKLWAMGHLEPGRYPKNCATLDKNSP